MAQPVCRREGVRDLSRHTERLLEWQRAFLQTLSQRLAGQVLHHRHLDSLAAPTSSVVEAKLVSCCPMSPTVLRVERYRFFFFSNEGHELPHVHAQDGDKLAKLWLEPVVLAASTGFAPHELTRIHALVVERHDMLLEAWHEFFRP